MDLGFTAVPAITVICYLLAIGIKATGKIDKWIPVICGILGGVLGVVAMYTIPGYPGTDILAAIAIGVVSGEAATGINQVYKQLTQKSESD